jgi:hypothetical protein
MMLINHLTRLALVALIALTISPSSADAAAKKPTIPLPDHSMTPGAVDRTLTKEKLCDPAFHTATARNVTLSEKLAVCHAYGLLHDCPGPGYELDHLVSIELGGANDPGNLWPQPVDAPGVIGFHTKDVVENRTHKAMCSGKLTLRQAQEGIAGNWYSFGLKYGFITK